MFFCKSIEIWFFYLCGEKIQSSCFGDWIHGHGSENNEKKNNKTVSVSRIEILWHNGRLWLWRTILRTYQSIYISHTHWKHTQSYVLFCYGIFRFLTLNGGLFQYINYLKVFLKYYKNEKYNPFVFFFFFSFFFFFLASWCSYTFKNDKIILSVPCIVSPYWSRWLKKKLSWKPLKRKAIVWVLLYLQNDFRYGITAHKNT